VRPREIMGIVAGTRTRSGSTNFLRLHVLGDRLADTNAHRGEKTSKPRKSAHKPARKTTRVGA